MGSTTGLTGLEITTVVTVTLTLGMVLGGLAGKPSLRLPGGAGLPGATARQAAEKAPGQQRRFWRLGAALFNAYPQVKPATVRPGRHRTDRTRVRIG
ncbi:MAG TPA: hypothetical protein VF062_15770 [Candidatus Limnocylindrales bacterium]